MLDGNLIASFLLVPLKLISPHLFCYSDLEYRCFIEIVALVEDVLFDDVRKYFGYIYIYISFYLVCYDLKLVLIY